MLQRFCTFVVLAVLAWVSAFALGGCAQTGPVPGPAGAAAEAPAAAAPDEYRLGSGDKLRVIVFGEDSLSREYVVSGAGTVAFPLIGDVPAAGRSGRELANDIERKLRDGFIREPRVSVEVLTYRPFYILGEVEAPGEYPYTSGLTVLNAVATAKGFTYRADQRRVFIKRAGEAAEREVPLTGSVVVQPGDTIRIRERFF